MNRLYFAEKAPFVFNGTQMTLMLILSNELRAMSREYFSTKERLSHEP
jgi:hypothetical protein